METHQQPNVATTDDSISMVEIPPSIINNDNNHKRKKVLKDITAIPSTKATSSSSSSSSSSSALSSAHKSERVAYKRRKPKIVFAPVRRSSRGGSGNGDVDAIALPLGMSFAAVVAKVLERKDAADERMSVHHLSMICTSAVRESLAIVFGDKFDFFTRNFEKSFRSTLNTLGLINESFTDKGAYHSSRLHVESSASDVTVSERVGCMRSSNIKNCHSETGLPNISIQNRMHVPEEVEENMSTDCMNQELVLHGQINQLVLSPSTLGSVIGQLSTIEKSVMEQARSNDLKTVEIGLTMRKLKLKETQLALSLDSNHLERSKLEMGKEKAYLKAEKFKSQLKDTRHSELLSKCIDCLVTGLFIMSASLLYGTYIHSYKRITEATVSCAPSSEGSKSWWIPRPVSSFNSGLHTVWCQVQVVIRMLFGILMILSVAYLLLQRSSTSRQTMPVTFVLLLLGAFCGFAGKLCVDTLGGSGLLWLLYWEILCLVHFFANVCTSTLFRMLYGPVSVSQGMKHNAICPYWFRKFLFYGTVLLFLPLCCGLLPFAGPDEWKEHFLLLVTDFVSITAY